MKGMRPRTHEGAIARRSTMPPRSVHGSIPRDAPRRRPPLGTDALTLMGTKGTLVVKPVLLCSNSLQHEITIGRSKSLQSPKNIDRFSGELYPSSDCILDDKDPEPDGEEGSANLPILVAVLEDIRSKKPVVLKPFTCRKPIDPGAQTTSKGRRSRGSMGASNAGKGKSISRRTDVNTPAEEEASRA